jgi:hypothetical protein
MQTLATRLIAALSIGASFLPQAVAQPAPPPPRLEVLEEQEPAVTIRSAPGTQQITEKREQGRVTSVRVKSGKSNYQLKPNLPAGSAQPGDAQSDASRPAQWQVMEFDWNREQERREAAERAAATTPPPPPPVNAN